MKRDYLLGALAIWLGMLAAWGHAEQPWIERIVTVPYPPKEPAGPLTLLLLRQDYEQLQTGRSVLDTPLVIGRKRYEHGLGTHSVGHIRLRSAKPIVRFSAEVGVDNNQRTQGRLGSVVFRVSADGKQRFQSPTLRGGKPPQRVDLELGGANLLDLHVGDAGDGPSCDHADWADAKITLAGGISVWLDQIKPSLPSPQYSRYPFSFTYHGKPSDELLPNWTRQEQTQPSEGRGRQVTTTWTDPKTGLRVRWQVVRFADFPAAEWLLFFENTGPKDTPIIENLRSLDVTLRGGSPGQRGYRLHRTNGAPSNPTDFEPTLLTLAKGDRCVLGAGGGRSSNKDFPFFKIETPRQSYLIAVGWSGQWQAQIKNPDGRHLHLTAGLEKTRFRLSPGQRVRSPRMLLLHWQGDTLESNAQFRRLIYRHYAARRNGKRLLPVLYCNTCFTRGGGWLNECNAANQISLIHAYAPLGLEALLTDAGWFKGGWPAGAGNWTPRKDAYPQGMGPVAAAAKSREMVYGLWFEFERVTSGTWLHQHHPEWLLHSTDKAETTYLLNLGLPEVREYLFQTVKGFMDLPGFRVYRQDFNLDPLRYWRHSDPPDRQGITEMEYVAGLYEFWDRIARTWPDSLRIECASGGRRIDLETVSRMHVHQKSDYWFDNDVDQASIWGLSQYLPNHVFMAPLNRMDDYSFHSAMATSLCLGWIADAPDFDRPRARRLVERYRELRHLLVGAWYPLLPYTRDSEKWMAVQYDRPDLKQGMVLVFRHRNSPYQTANLPLHGLDPHANYELRSLVTNRVSRAAGAELMKRWLVTLPKAGSSDLVVYRMGADE